MNIIFLPAAEQELTQAAEFYEQQLNGLGILFYKEVFEAVDFIRLYPGVINSLPNIPVSALCAGFRIWFFMAL